MRLYRFVSEHSEFIIEVSPWLDEQMRTKPLSQQFLEHVTTLCGSAFVNTPRRWGFGGALRRDTFTHTESVQYVASLLDARHRAIAASIDTLVRLFALSADEEVLSEEERPLIALQGLSFRHARSGWDMGAELSVTMQRLMTQFDESSYKRIIQRMISVGKRFDEHATAGALHIAEGTFMLEVPGDVTQLYSFGDVSVLNGTLKLVGHNIDRPSQQFALLAGLAEASVIAEELEREEGG